MTDHAHDDRPIATEIVPEEPDYVSLRWLTFLHAGYVINEAVYGRETPQGVEVMPGCALMVAGAALALTEGAPWAFDNFRRTTLDDLLNADGERRRNFQAAVGRVIEIHKRDPRSFETAGDVMRHVVSDMMHQGHAGRLHHAVEHPDRMSLMEMSDGDHRTIEAARDDKRVSRELLIKSQGLYKPLDDRARAVLGAAIKDGEMITDASATVIAIAAAAIDRAADLASDRARDSSLAEFREFGQPLFPVVEEAHRDRASQVASGAASPCTATETAIRAHVALEERRLTKKGHWQPGQEDDANRMAAYARALVRSERPGGSPAEPAREAARIAADIVNVRRLRYDALTAVDQNARFPGEVHAIAVGNIRADSLKTQIALFTAIENLDHVSPLQQVELAFTAHLVERRTNDLHASISKNDGGATLTGGKGGDEVRLSGTVMLKADRLWLVPLGEDPAGPVVTDAAREVTSTAGSFRGMASRLDTEDSAYRAPTFAETKEFFRTSPAVGYFVVRPAIPGDRNGPVQMVAATWMGDVDHTRASLASEAIGHSERRGRVPSGAMVGAAMADRER